MTTATTTTMVTTNGRYPRPYRGNKADWFGRSSKSRGIGPTTNGHSSVWMHDDRFGPFRQYKNGWNTKTAGTRFGKRSLFDRKFDARSGKTLIREGSEWGFFGKDHLIGLVQKQQMEGVHRRDPL
ncbi:unnamed protein product [Echinostoma caproni]|uniref:Myelin basic protein n=1 Tax=Echinostoma caproni TaxID=27848 RepID=A0A183ABM5_9TREM|nr:unnamed protein product [Echinostoma caproni]